LPLKNKGFGGKKAGNKQRRRLADEFSPLFIWLFPNPFKFSQTHTILSLFCAFSTAFPPFCLSKSFLAILS
jgi:hypothetical protein